jgi:stage III sporulation protein AG
MMEQRKKPASGLWGFWGARGRIWLLLCGVIGGIFLLVLGSAMQETQESASAARTEDLSAMQSYEQHLEKEIAALCDEVAGVGHCEVMVHLRGGTRVIYATDEKGKPVLVGSGSAEQALPATVLTPEIAGVGVVCRGGEKPAVQQTLVELISTTLGIPANRVFVAGK